MRLNNFLLIISFFICWEVVGNEIKLKGEVVQGGLVIGWTSPGASIYLNDLPILQGKSGDFLLGFPFNAKRNWNSPERIFFRNFCLIRTSKSGSSSTTSILTKWDIL